MSGSATQPPAAAAPPGGVYDALVAGSGAAGLTAALLLALAGRSVLVVEKAPRPGGSLARFRRRGVPFDTGFHFTGGLQPGGVLDGMLRVLGVRDAIEPVFLDADRAHRFLVESSGADYDIPSGIDRVRERWSAYFPAEAAGIGSYLDAVESVCARTPGMDPRAMDRSAGLLDEDFISLARAMDGRLADPALRSLAAAFSLCHGTPPGEVSFAAHSRVCQGLFQSVARVRGGGGALVAALAGALGRLGVEIACGAGLAGWADVRDGRPGAAVLDDGRRVAFRDAVLAFHPAQILERIAPLGVRPALAERVRGFAPSAGFFAVFATVAPAGAPPFERTIVSLLPHDGLDALMSPAGGGDRPLVLVGSAEGDGDGAAHTLTMLELSFPEHVAAWAASRTGRRPAGYAEYKAARQARILARVAAAFPSLAAGLRVADAASVLTFRDYLHSPDGAAYGIRQRAGQYNLLGRLPLRNLYAAGQSALLPGLVGAMASGFLVTRLLLGRGEFAGLVARRLPA